MSDDLALFGTNLFGKAIQPKAGVVAQKFIWPPFSILDTRTGEWQKRKKAWLSMGILGEIGRDDGLTFGKGLGVMLADGTAESTTSIFDPVLCELMYRWFCPVGGQVVDPFAGGSVRGIVASYLGMQYWGCDLREAQIEANEGQANLVGTPIRPYWVCGDSKDMLESSPASDFVFSCPPYGDLEVYSNDPNDLSNMEWDQFLDAYLTIIGKAIKNLKDNSFACFVVGDFRCKKGFYRNFVGKTVNAFEDAGAHLYNEAIMVNVVGSAGMRVTKQFDASRKMVKTHQNVLIFCKGDPRVATQKISQPSQK